jgi:NAD(P)-dependent dehydrogenase (short-subunit alcohol dehydrogenase family)
MNHKTVIVTGASRGIGAGVVKAFLRRGYDVVGTARSATESKEFSASDQLALIDGDIGQFETAQKVAELAIKKFGSIDAVVANAGIFLAKPSVNTQRMIFVRLSRPTSRVSFTSRSSR